MTISRRSMTLGATAGCLLLFAVLASEMMERETTPFDVSVRQFALGRQSPGVRVLAEIMTWIGKTQFFGAAVVLLVVWLRRGLQRRLAAGIVAMSTTSVLAMALFKALFRRTRPDGAVALGELGYSFPSGHAMNSMAMAVTLTYVLWREGLAPRWTIGAAVVFSLLVGMSRVYLDVHWATDVLGGWTIGLAIAGLCAEAYEWRRCAAGLAVEVPRTQ